MAWIALSAEDIENSLSATEHGVFDGDSAAEADLAVIVQSVTGLVRGKVNSAKRNQGHMGPPGTIPDELYAAAISIARFKLITHFPENQLMAPDREADVNRAYDELGAVARGELVVVRADDPLGATPEPGSEYGGESFFEPYIVNQPQPPYVPYVGYPF
jgi:hypothetical protein